MALDVDFRQSRAACKSETFDEAGGASTSTLERRGGVVLAAVEIDPGAGALELGSKEGALTKDFSPFSADCKNIRRNCACAFALKHLYLGRIIQK
jgi:hypothetical protein